jgi:YVTN family beta-propeller protein
MPTARARWWPLLHVAPNGKLFHSGPTPQMHWVNPAGNGSYSPVGGEFTDWYHKHGTTVMYDEGRLLTAGGWVAGNDTASTDLAFTVDLNGPSPVVTPTQPMRHARKFLNGVMLPTGDVLVIGGNTSGEKFSDAGSVLAPELWDPDTGEWTELAPMDVPRNYHSVALLLTDGRVLAAGSGYSPNGVPQSTHQDGQMFEPPYLFAADGTPAPRPAIVNGPGVVETGTTFSLTTSEPVEYFSLVKMSSTTHGVNTDLRYLRPAFVSPEVNTYEVTLHGNPNVATPGYWMLFAVNAEGVPSEAHVLRITAVDTRFENVALQGMASQSSVAIDDPDADAANAIDGDLSGTPSSGSLARTEPAANAWWEIDLGRQYDLDTLRLWNRTDCCADALSDVHVLVSPQPFTSQDLEQTRWQAGVTDFFLPGALARQTDLALGVTGRYLRIQLEGEAPLQLAEVQLFGEASENSEGTPVLFENGLVSDVGSEWVTVPLAGTYVDPVVIATPRYSATQAPLVTRIRNAGGNQFELRVQVPGEVSTPDAVDVHYFVVEAGTYDTGGLRMEAVKFESSVVDRSGSWRGEARSYLQSYTDPVVFGQVMTENDPRWSVFWASGDNQATPPSATTLRAGRHVGEDPDSERAPETIGYVVIEAGSGATDDFSYVAGLGADIVRGVGDGPPYVYDLGGSFDFAVLSAAAMQGGNGGWPVLYGDAPLAGGQLALAFDEDQVLDSERFHTTEPVAYFAMTRSAARLYVEAIAPTPQQAGDEITYSADAIGPGSLSYSWNFGDGDTAFSSDPSMTHSFPGPGRYTVTLTVRDGLGNEQYLTFTQLVHRELTAAASAVSTGILEYADRGEVWNVNPDNDSVTVIDTALQTVVAEIPVDDEPRSLAIAPDGRVWVVNKEAATISIIDPATRQTDGLLFLPVGAQPHGMVIGASGAWVVLEGTGTVMQLDPYTGLVLQQETVGGRLRHIARDAASGKLYVSRFVTPPVPGEGTASPVVDDGVNLYGGEVVVLDAATLAALNTVVLRHGNRPVSEHSGPGLPNYLGPAVISPDGTAAWVPSKQDNILAGALRGGPGMTFDQVVRAVTSKIELPTDVEHYEMRVDHDNASVAGHAAFGPYGLHLFTTLEGNREVAVIDAINGLEVMRFDVGRAPQSVAVSQDGQRLYVHNFMDRSVGIYDIRGLIENGDPNAIRELATVATVTNEALTPTVLLGKQLFYDARDDRLAALDYMSCASCHNEGGDDGRVWDFTGRGEGLRNTITLLGRAGMGHGFLHWSANFDEIQDFEAQIRDFAGGAGLMDDADYLAGTRSEPLGDPKAGVSADLDALAAYVASLATVPTSPWRDLDRTLSDSAQAGLAIFDSAGCDSCHQLPRLTDSSDGTGLQDVGTVQPSSGSRLGGALTGIDTPTLLGAWATPPYLHDGSAPTLQAAIAAHAGVLLTDTELDQVAALIREIESGVDLVGGAGPKLVSGVVQAVGTEWQTVLLPNEYADMVVVATPQYSADAAPVVPRIRNAAGNSFEIRLQNPGDGAVVDGRPVHYVVAEAGRYDEVEDGIRMEAVKVTLSDTKHKGNWLAATVPYQQSYVDPVVLGQVMTENDPAWSAFFATGDSIMVPPSPAALRIGRHVGEDPDQIRETETVGYLVIEAGSGSSYGVDYLAGRTARVVVGIASGAAAVPLGGQYAGGVATMSGVQGGDGGWAVLVGTDPFAAGQMLLSIDEDQVADSDRWHTEEEVSYLVFP